MKTIAMAFALLLFLVGPGNAEVICDPACPAGQICSYDAEGNKICREPPIVLPDCDDPLCGIEDRPAAGGLDVTTTQMEGCCEYCPDGESCKSCGLASHELCGEMTPVSCSYLSGDMLVCVRAFDSPSGDDDLPHTAVARPTVIDPIPLNPTPQEPLYPPADDGTPIPTDAVPETPTAIPASPAPSNAAPAELPDWIKDNSRYWSDGTATGN